MYSRISPSKLWLAECSNSNRETIPFYILIYKFCSLQFFSLPFTISTRSRRKMLAKITIAYNPESKCQINCHPRFWYTANLCILKKNQIQSTVDFREGIFDLKSLWVKLRFEIATHQIRYFSFGNSKTCWRKKKKIKEGTEKTNGANLVESYENLASKSPKSH